MVFDHDADGHQAVEPGVGGLFGNIGNRGLTDGFAERLPLVVEVLRHHVAHKNGAALEKLGLSGYAAIGGEAEGLEALAYAQHEDFASLGGKCF